MKTTTSKRRSKMGFRKTGIAPVGDVLCNCGAQIKGHVDKCPKCGKTLIAEKVRTSKKTKKDKK
jgi:hypothetical protein